MVPDRSPAECALDVQELTKSYGATVALRSVSLRVRRGEVHALVGENGAGKSTLVKILSGIVMPDSGNVELEGVVFRPHSPSVGSETGRHWQARR